MMPIRRASHNSFRQLPRLARRRLLRESLYLLLAFLILRFLPQHLFAECRTTRKRAIRRSLLTQSLAGHAEKQWRIIARQDITDWPIYTTAGYMGDIYIPRFGPLLKKCRRHADLHAASRCRRCRRHYEKAIPVSDAEHTPTRAIFSCALTRFLLPTTYRRRPRCVDSADISATIDINAASAKS